MLMFNNYDKLEADFRASIYHVIYEHVSCERPSRYVRLLNTLVEKDGLPDQLQQNTFLNFFFAREYERNGIVLIPRVNMVRDDDSGQLIDLKIFWDPCCAFRRASQDDIDSNARCKDHPFPWIERPTFVRSPGYEVTADDIGRPKLEHCFLLSHFHSDNNILAREYWDKKVEIQDQWEHFQSDDDVLGEQMKIKEDWFYNEQSNYIAYLCQMYFLVAKLCACRNSSARLFFATALSASKQQKGFLRQINGTPNPGLLPLSDMAGYERVVFSSELTTISTIPRAHRNSETTSGYWLQYPCSNQMYYEVTIVKAMATSFMQLGWTLFPNEEFTHSRSKGVGNNFHSWSCDGIQKQTKGAPKGILHRFHGDKQYNSIDLAQPWREGDTIGCLVDLKMKKMYCITMQAGVMQSIVIFSDTDSFPEAQDHGIQLHPAISGINCTLRVNFGIDKGKKFRFFDKLLMTNLQKPSLNLPLKQPVFAWDDGQPVIPSFRDLTDIVFCDRLPSCVRVACNMLLKEIYYDQAPMHSEHIIEETQIVDDRKSVSTSEIHTGTGSVILNVSDDIEMSSTNPVALESSVSNFDIDVKFEISLYVQRALLVLSSEDDLVYSLVQKDGDDAKTFLIHITSCIKHFLTFRAAFSAEILHKFEAFIEATCNLYFEVVRHAKQVPQPSTSKNGTHDIETNTKQPLEYTYRCFHPSSDSLSTAHHRRGSTRHIPIEKKRWILDISLPKFESERSGNDRKFQNWHSAFEDGLSGTLLIQICQLMGFGWDIKYARILSEAFEIAASKWKKAVNGQQSSQNASQQLLQLIQDFNAGDNFLEHSLDVADLPHSGVRTSIFGLINRYFTSKPKLLQLFDELQILDHHHEIDGFSKSKKYIGVLDSSVQWLRHCIADPTCLEWDSVPNVFSDRLGHLWDAIESLIALCTTQNEFDENVALMSSWVAPDVSILFMKLDGHENSRDEIEPYEPTRAQTLPSPNNP